MTEFALARLGEDQAVADGLLTACRDPRRSPDFAGCCGGPAAEAYWERFGPARALADIAMKRELLQGHGPGTLVDESGGRWRDDPDNWDPPWRRCAGHEWAAWPCRDARIIVATWSAHPDYKAKWKP